MAVNTGNVEGIGVAIGEGASVNIWGSVQYFPAEAKAPLRAIFEPLIKDRLALFAGRDAALVKIDAFLATERGHLMVTAPAGFGKTALMAHVVKTHPACAYHFFAPIYADSLDEDFFLRVVVEQLARSHEIPDAIPRDRAQLRALYQELIAKPIEGPNLLVIDGLDEVLGWSVVPYLAFALPPGFHLVTTVRDSGQPWRTQFGLGAEVQQLSIGGLDREGVVAVLKAAGGTAAAMSEQADVVDALYQKLSYEADPALGADPLYTRFLAQDMSARPAAPELAATYPNGLVAYLDRWWDELKRAAGDQATKDLLGTLAAALGPLRRQELEALNATLVDGWDASKADEVISTVRRWVAGDADRGYALAHPRLRQYIVDQRKLRLETYRNKLLAYCNDWAKHRSLYALRYRVAHLALADQFAELAACFTADWLAASWTAHGSYAEVAADLALAANALLRETPRRHALIGALILAQRRARATVARFPESLLLAWLRLGMTTHLAAALKNLVPNRVWDEDVFEPKLVMALELLAPGRTPVSTPAELELGVELLRQGIPGLWNWEKFASRILAVFGERSVLSAEVRASLLVSLRPEVPDHNVSVLRAVDLLGADRDGARDELAVLAELFAAGYDSFSVDALVRAWPPGPSPRSELVEATKQQVQHSRRPHVPLLALALLGELELIDALVADQWITDDRGARETALALGPALARVAPDRSAALLAKVLAMPRPTAEELVTRGVYRGMERYHGDLMREFITDALAEEHARLACWAARLGRGDLMTPELAGLADSTKRPAQLAACIAALTEAGAALAAIEAILPEPGDVDAFAIAAQAAVRTSIPRAKALVGRALQLALAHPSSETDIPRAQLAFALHDAGRFADAAATVSSHGLDAIELLLLLICRVATEVAAEPYVATIEAIIGTTDFVKNWRAAPGVTVAILDAAAELGPRFATAARRLGQAAARPYANGSFTLALLVRIVCTRAWEDGDGCAAALVRLAEHWRAEVGKTLVLPNDQLADVYLALSQVVAVLGPRVPPVLAAFHRLDAFSERPEGHDLDVRAAAAAVELQLDPVAGTATLERLVAELPSVPRAEPDHLSRFDRIRASDDWTRLRGDDRYRAEAATVLGGAALSGSRATPVAVRAVLVALCDQSEHWATEFRDQLLMDLAAAATKQPEFSEIIDALIERAGPARGRVAGAAIIAACKLGDPARARVLATALGGDLAPDAALALRIAETRAALQPLSCFEQLYASDPNDPIRNLETVRASRAGQETALLDRMTEVIVAWDGKEDEDDYEPHISMLVRLMTEPLHALGGVAALQGLIETIASFDRAFDAAAAQLGS